MLQIAERLSLLPAGIGKRAADAYRNLRRLQHQARLSGATHAARIEPEDVSSERAAVCALTATVLGAPCEQGPVARQMPSTFPV